MDEWPKLSIVLLTYMRTPEAIRTIKGLCNFLGYEKTLRSWYIADDGSPKEHVDTLLNLLGENAETILGFHNRRYSPRPGVGWNLGLGLCFQNSDYVLVMEDDWELRGPLDIHPFVKMLSEREDVGMVRLGHLAIGNDVSIVGHNGHHYLKYLRNHPYAYSGNPHLRHARFMRAYGWYDESELNPGELETNYDYRFCTIEGPDIWRPADIPGWGIFGHIGEKRYR